MYYRTVENKEYIYLKVYGGIIVHLFENGKAYPIAFFKIITNGKQNGNSTFRQSNIKLRPDNSNYQVR
jgi:hypothetical protein